jgi:hypothetical protein
VPAAANSRCPAVIDGVAQKGDDESEHHRMPHPVIQQPGREGRRRVGLLRGTPAGLRQAEEVQVIDHDTQKARSDGNAQDSSRCVSQPGA